MPVQVSPDGRWWWDGTRWRSRVVEGELSLFWFTSTPEWVARVVVSGLIGLIPIVGAINLYGWTLTSADMIRRGWRELPPANFSYLERGVPYFLVSLVYGVAVFAVVVAIAVAAVAIGLARSVLLPLAFGIGAIDVLLLLAAGAAGLYMFGAMLTASDRLGIGAALNPFHVFAIARANHQASLDIAVTYFVASLVLALGSAMVSFVIPFGGIAVSVVRPAILALVVPGLARINLDD